MARPSDYNQETAKQLLDYISQGYSLRRACEQEGMPERSTFFRWIHDNPEFRNQYEIATEERTEAQNELLLELGDDAIELAQEVDSKASNAVVSAVKLKADNLKWVMSKQKPKKYGDKLDLTSKDKQLPTPIINVLPNNSNE